MALNQSLFPWEVHSFLTIDTTLDLSQKAEKRYLTIYDTNLQITSVNGRHSGFQIYK